jgi:shikimate kinase
MTAADRNIVITGFMGTGKSTVGRLVAKMTKRTFIDTDETIVQRVGISIPEIFARNGEQYFRQMERELCRYLAAQSGLVISTGGGTLVDEDNRATMLASGFVVCLNATSEAILNRVGHKQDRPLLKGDWHALLEKRRAAYVQIPYQVDTTDKKPEQVAEEIAKLWQNASK